MADYTETTLELVFTTDGMQSIMIPITDDFIPEHTNKFFVYLHAIGPSSVTIDQPTAQASVTILDNDSEYYIKKSLCFKELHARSLKS